MKRMSRTGIRLTDQERKELEEASERLDLHISDLLRKGAIALLKHIRKHNGKLVLPVDYDDDLIPRKKKKKSI